MAGADDEGGTLAIAVKNLAAGKALVLKGDIMTACEVFSTSLFLVYFLLSFLIIVTIRRE